MCTNLTVFLLEENEVVDMCTHFMFVFFRRRKIADMCPNVMFFSGSECRHVY